MTKLNIAELRKIIEKTRSSALLSTPAKPVLSESSLSRVMHHMDEHETAIVTAFRNDPSDMVGCTDATKNKDKEMSDGSPKVINKKRNKELKAVLLSFGYGVTKVDGSYIENFDTPKAHEVAEESFFVVNLKDSRDFVEDMAMLGEEFCQDSVLVIPKGGDEAYLLGTNDTEFPGYGEKVEVGTRKFGGEAEFMTRVGKRPFTFGEGLQTYEGLSRMQRMAVKSMARKILNAAAPRTKNI